MNMINLPRLRFQMFLIWLTIFLVHGCSNAILFLYLSNHVSEVRNFGNTLAMSVIFFWICSKFNLDLENAEKGSEKFFSFWDSSIWIGCVKYSLLITEDLPYSVNALTNILRFCISVRVTFSNSFAFTIINKYDNRAAVKISTVFRRVYHIAC